MLILFWMFASLIRMFPFLWENYREPLFSWFLRYCDNYLKTVQTQLLVRQSNCQYISLANRLQHIPKERKFSRWLLTRCIKLFRSDLNIEQLSVVKNECMQCEVQKG